MVTKIRLRALERNIKKTAAKKKTYGSSGPKQLGVDGFLVPIEQKLQLSKLVDGSKAATG